MRALIVVLLLWLVSFQAGYAQMQTPPAETLQDQVSPTQTPQAQLPQGLATPPPPQTARQALIEMFIAAKPGALEKHLPDITRKTLMSGGDPMKSDVLREFVTFSAGFTANQKHFETFDDGPLLLSMEPVPGAEKLEIAVERDDRSETRTKSSFPSAYIRWDSCSRYPSYPASLSP